MRTVVRGLVAVALATALVGPTASAGAAEASIPYSCETGVPAIGTLSAPIAVATTTAPEPAGIFAKVSYTADLSLPDLTPQPFAINFNFFRITLDVPDGLRDVKVKVQDPSPAVANPRLDQIAARVVGEQIVVDVPAVPATWRRFYFGTDGNFSYPFNTATQSGGRAVVLPRLKVTAMPTYTTTGRTITWHAPAVDTFTQFFNIGDIPCRPDDPGAVLFQTTETTAVAIPPNPHTDVPGGLDAAVSWARHLKVYKLGTARFSPSAPATRSEAVLALWNLVDRPTPTGQHPFVDVPANAPYEAALDWAFGAGVVRPHPKNKFKPTASVLRGHLADMVFRTVEADEGSPWPAFAYTDVPAGAFYAEALRWIDANDIMIEYFNGTRIRPTVAATRGDLARTLYRTARSTSWFRPLPTTVLVAAG